MKKIYHYFNKKKKVDFFYIFDENFKNNFIFYKDYKKGLIYSTKELLLKLNLSKEEQIKNLILKNGKILESSKERIQKTIKIKEKLKEKILENIELNKNIDPLFFDKFFLKEKINFEEYNDIEDIEKMKKIDKIITKLTKYIPLNKKNETHRIIINKKNEFQIENFFKKFQIFFKKKSFGKNSRYEFKILKSYFSKFNNLWNQFQKK